MYYSFGETLWDVFGKDKVMGGAAFNVAAHLRKLGAQAILISGIGDDANGQEILSILNKRDMATSCIYITQEHPTGIVQVKLDSQGIPSYDIVYPSAWDFIKFEGEVPNNSTLIFGTLALRNSVSRDTLMMIKDKFSRKVFDINLRKPFYDEKVIINGLIDCNILKINDEEMLLLAQYMNVSEDNVIQYLFEKFSISLIIQTLGSKGAEISTTDGKRFKAQPPQVQVVDTVGCGDSFLAGFLYFYDTTHDIQHALDKAVKLSSLVASKRGAVPNYSSLDL